MTIGGDDVILQRRGTAAWRALELAIACIRKSWGGAIVQDAETAKEFLSDELIPFRSLCEILVYCDRSAFASWARYGATRSNKNRMIHLLASHENQNETLTVVVGDSEDAEMKAILKDISDDLAAQSAANVDK